VTIVLLIDDEPEMGSLVGMCLDETGARVVQVHDLAGAIAAGRQERPSLVLLDLALGSEDGLDILPRLRGESSLSRVPIVAFSVHENRRGEALDQGVDGFVAKPFKALDLRRELQLHMGQEPKSGS
jgi:two-component system, OmpR family, response regulator